MKFVLMYTMLTMVTTFAGCNSRVDNELVVVRDTFDSVEECELAFDIIRAQVKASSEMELSRNTEGFFKDNRQWREVGYGSNLCVPQDLAERIGAY